MAEGMSGGGMFSFLEDPNMQQWMANAGQKLMAGENWAAALNPSDLIAQKQLQGALGGIPKKPVATPAVAEAYSGTAGGAFDFLNGIEPTPLGTPGLDSKVIKQTADGTTVTMTAPSTKNLNTFGSNVPAESMPASTAQAGGQTTSPFWRATLRG